MSSCKLMIVRIDHSQSNILFVFCYNWSILTTASYNYGWQNYRIGLISLILIFVIPKFSEFIWMRIKNFLIKYQRYLKITAWTRHQFSQTIKYHWYVIQRNMLIEKNIVVTTIKVTTTQVLYVELMYIVELFYNDCNYKIIYTTTLSLDIKFV